MKSKKKVAKKASAQSTAKKTVKKAPKTTTAVVKKAPAKKAVAKKATKKAAAKKPSAKAAPAKVSVRSRSIEVGSNVKVSIGLFKGSKGVVTKVGKYHQVRLTFAGEHTTVEVAPEALTLA